jgi:hypothetical protein
MRSSVRQALALDPKGGPGGASHVVHAKCHAGVVSELELGRVAVKVLLSAVLTDALHASFEDRERAFDGVRADVAAGAFRATVVHDLMAREVLAEAKAPAAFVGQMRASRSTLARMIACNSSLAVPSAFASHTIALAG